MTSLDSHSKVNPAVDSLDHIADDTIGLAWTVVLGGLTVPEDLECSA
jgi:hypothetical protein